MRIDAPQAGPSDPKENLGLFVRRLIQHGKIGLAHPLVQTLFEPSVVEGWKTALLRKVDSEPGNDTIANGADMQLSQEETARLQGLLFLAQEEGFQVPREMELSGEWSVDTRVKIALALGKDVERTNFTMEGYVIKSNAIANATALEKRFPGLKITLNWGKGTQGGLQGAVKKASTKPVSHESLLTKTEVEVTVTGIPKELYIAEPQRLLLYLDTQWH